MRSTKSKLHALGPSLSALSSIKPASLSQALDACLGSKINVTKTLTWTGGADGQPFYGTFTNIVGTWTGSGSNNYAPSIIDNNWNYSGGVFNAKGLSSVTASGTVAGVAAGTNLFATDFIYYFANDEVNYRKKAKYIDVYYYNGSAWILGQTFTTSTPYIGGPTTQTFTFTTPMPVPSPYFQIRVTCRDNSGDPLGYLWVTEIQFHYKVV